MGKRLNDGNQRLWETRPMCGELELVVSFSTLLSPAPGIPQLDHYTLIICTEDFISRAGLSNSTRNFRMEASRVMEESCQGEVREVTGPFQRYLSGKNKGYGI